MRFSTRPHKRPGKPIENSGTKGWAAVGGGNGIAGPRRCGKNSKGKEEKKQNEDTTKKVSKRDPAGKKREL